jgi:pyruvate/2-oxoglutarate dehydrogenase complex dihydrolipoamide acyltransferase (E2) component
MLQLCVRSLHSTCLRRATTRLEMPAMSPTMTQGNIAQGGWKIKEGEKFSAGDVLLEIETDKATIDIEAPDSGILGKIVVPDGTKSVPVGKVIALLAEEGDDLNNLEIPPLEPALSQQKDARQTKTENAPSLHQHVHSETRLFPSVSRLLSANSLDVSKIKGTGQV